ncbi:MAG: hypothetical protein ACPGU4_14380, partial [Flavobacteriales bacterium]
MKRFSIMRYLGMRITFFLLFLCFVEFVSGQSVENQIVTKQQKMVEIELQSDQLVGELEALRLLRIREQMDELGYPASEESLQTVHHIALSLGYSEPDEQAAWVQHMVIPEVEFANVSRTNDFRSDSLVKTG